METKKKTSAWVYVFRVLFTFCLIGTVLFIFSNSLQIASASSGRSQQVMLMVNNFAQPRGFGPFTEHQIRKLAHMAEYAMLGFWFTLCLRAYTAHFIKHISWPLFICLLIADIDETIQFYVAGRSSQLSDVWIDFSGVLCGAFVALVILVFLHMCACLVRRAFGHKEAAA